MWDGLLQQLHVHEEHQGGELKQGGFWIHFDILVISPLQGFMVQTGDPTNTGKGGESIWGGKFQV